MRHVGAEERPGSGDGLLVHEAFDVCKNEPARAGKTKQQGDDGKPAGADLEDIGAEVGLRGPQQFNQAQALLQSEATVRRVVLIGDPSPLDPAQTGWNGSADFKALFSTTDLRIDVAAPPFPDMPSPTDNQPKQMVRVKERFPPRLRAAARQRTSLAVGSGCHDTVADLRQGQFAALVGAAGFEPATPAV